MLGQFAANPTRRFAPPSPSQGRDEETAEVRGQSSLFLSFPSQSRGRDERISLFLTPPTSWGGWHIVSAANDVTGGALHPRCRINATVESNRARSARITLH